MMKRIFFLAFCLIWTKCHALLVASTVNVIQGNEPLLVLDNGVTVIESVDDLLIVTLPDGVTQHLPATAPYPLTTVSSNESLNQFATKLLADNQVISFSAEHFDDKDGDEFSSVSGYYQATWQDKKRQVIENINIQFDACNAPYYLTIKAGDSSNPIVVNSKYGYTQTKNYGYGFKTYRIDVKDKKLCYLKPTDMSVRSTGTTLFGSYAYGGYNASVFDSKNGFIPTKTTFPSTAFPKATFQMIMSGLQTDYNYQVEIDGVIVSDSTNPSAYTKEIEIDSNGKVVFNSKPTKGSWPATIKLIAKHKNDIDAPIMTYSSKIDVWVVSSDYMDPDRTKDGYTAAVSYCEGKGGTLALRSQLTNSPYANSSYFPANASQPPVGTSPNWWGPQYFTRDSNASDRLSRSLTSEWGRVYNYTDSKMGTGYYTSEYYDSASSTTVYGVSMLDGEVRRYSTTGIFTALCLL